MAKNLSLILCLSALVALFTCVSQAQDYRGRIQGTVTDASSAVVPGANVVLLNTKTGIKAVRQTNETGHYLFDFMEPGTYTLSVEATGFSGFVQENITLQTRADLTVDAALKTGAVQETIRVESSAVAVQFNTSKLETTVDSVLTGKMPQYNRSPFLLAQLDPSVIPSVGNGDWNPYNSWGPTRSASEAARPTQTIFRSTAAPPEWASRTATSRSSIQSKK